MSVLHSSVCSSPGGETGFDRLVTTFCNAVPHLTQALTEEIQVLTRLTEPSKVLSFLNAAYFRTVAQELATQMEREFERAQRDNTTPSKKIKRYSVRSRAAVAPVELPVKTRSFSLTSHQLKVLTQLACILLGFESKVRELVTNMTFINYTEDSGKLKNIRKEDSNMAAEDRKPTSYKLYTPEVQTLEFNWRSAFSGLVPHMEHCVKVVLDDVCAKNLQQEEALHSSGCSSKYQEAIKAFKEQLTRYCIQVCMSSLFHDAESHNWADPKPFYEGERCSFSLQMWFYFLCGLRSDLWAVLPADLAKDVLGQLLKETLQLLVQRYARPESPVVRWLNAIKPDLYTERAIHTTQTVPVVITCVREIVSKSTNSLLLHLVIRVLSRQVTGESRGAPFKHHTPESVLAKIPKDWNYKSFDERRMDSNTSIYFLIQALSFIFTNLPSAVASMPVPIRFLFQEAEKHLSQHSRQLRPMGLLLWALLGCLIQGLEDPNTHEQLSGLALDGGAKECLSLIGECLQAAMNIQQKGVPKLTVHKVLQALEEKRPKWINAQMQKARKLCADSVFEQGVERRAAAAELTEQKIGLILLEVCHKAGGSSYLRQIYHIIQGNEDILMRKLSGRTDVSNEPLVNFNVGPETPSCFNPLLQFDHIGEKKLDQSAVVDWTWDWPRLLPAYQGMSQVTFRGLVANRWDMQEGVELEDAESAMVEELQKAVFVCCCHKNPQDPPGTDETPTKPTQGETPASDKSAAQ
uniref:KIAA0825 n=1 Tax=Iconisemion striatum TaxID=60296 RepID=A0A1A7Y376_9TELE